MQWQVLRSKRIKRKRNALCRTRVSNTLYSQASSMAVIFQIFKLMMNINKPVDITLRFMSTRCWQTHNVALPLCYYSRWYLSILQNSSASHSLLPQFRTQSSSVNSNKARNSNPVYFRNIWTATLSFCHLPCCPGALYHDEKKTPRNTWVNFPATTTTFTAITRRNQPDD